MSINNFDFDYIREILRKQVGIVLGEDKSYLVETRLNVLAQQHGVSLQKLLLQLRSQPSPNLYQEVIDAMAINETLFYRDEHPFKTLRTIILPEILTQRANQQSLNIWCAACSSGQEPYSVAMLLREYFPKLLNWNVRIIASDISHTMLARAREGCYSQFEVKRGLSLRLLNKYFQRQEKDWRINVEIRRMVEFREINLTTEWPLLPTIDILLLRNILIYFDNINRKTIINKAQQQLRTNGYLFAGASETALHRLNNQFKIVQLGNTIVYQKCVN